MKKRMGFVTNSSSSSFVCVICGNVESGYDASLSDCNMVQCKCGSVFCTSHTLDFPEPVVFAARCVCDMEELGITDPEDRRIAELIYKEYASALQSGGSTYSDTIVENVLGEMMEDEENTDREASLKEKTSGLIKRLAGSSWDEYVPDIFCPVCQFKSLSDDDIKTIACVLSGVKTTNELKDNMMARFKDRNEFNAWVEKNRQAS
jgi:hypothetical protein